MAKKNVAQSTPRSDGGYPYNALNSCLKLGEAVSIAGGREVPKGIVAHELGTDEGSSGFAQLCASAKAFGIVEGFRALSLTEQGQRYFLPETQGEKQLAQLAFLESPAAFRFLIDRFDGRPLPPVKMLAAILHKERGVPESWSGRAAGFFVSSVEEVGVKDAGGHLRFAVARHRIERAFVADALNREPAPQLNATEASYHASLNRDNGSSQVETTASSCNRWVFSEAGGTIRLETSDPLPRSLWERLKRYVEMLEPAELKKEGG